MYTAVDYQTKLIFLPQLYVLVCTNKSDNYLYVKAKKCNCG